MKLRNIFVSLLAAAATVVSCQVESESLGLPSIRFGQESLTFTQDGGSATINLTVSRDWTAEIDPTAEAEGWIGISRDSGEGSAKSQTIEISVLPNDGYNRSAAINFTVGKKLLTKAYIVYQDGPEGEAPISGPYYEYSLKTGGQGAFTIEDVTKPDAISAIWVYDSKYGMKATAFVGSTNYASESWLITPEIGLAATEHNYVSFTHAGQYFGTISNEATLWIAEADTKAGEDWKQLTIPTYPTSWTFVNSGDIDVSSYGGKVVKFAFKYMSTASKAGTWEVDALKISTTKAGDTPGGGEGSTDPVVTDGAIYFENFDKETATQTYGSGSSWPYLDQFEGWKNPQGTGASNVSYAFNGASARANSASNGSYSDYAGSGANNIFFGTDAYINVKNIALGGTANLTLTFGTEKYDSANKEAAFDNSEFLVYVSNTGEGASWVALDYAFPNGQKVSRWDLASATFTVPSGTTTLYLYFKSTLKSVHRLDDITLAPADAAGTTVDFSKGVDLGTSGGGNTGDDSSDPVDALYEYGFKASGQGQWTVENVTLPEGFSSVWTYDSKYGMKATAYANSTNFDSEGWLISPVITLPAGKAFVNFTHAANFFTSGAITSEATFWITDNTSASVSSTREWTQVTIPTYPTNWTFVNSGDLDISAFAGKDVKMAFRYTSTATKAGTWEVDVVKVTSDGQASPGESTDPSDESTDPSGESNDPVSGGAGTLVYEESFADGTGGFVIDNEDLPSGLSYVWAHDSSYKYMKASAYVGGTRYETKAWLYTEQPIDLTNYKEAYLTFEHTGKFFSNAPEEVMVCASLDGEDYQVLEIPGWFSNSDWTFVSSGNVDLSDFAGNNVYLAFVYTSTSTVAGTWEIKNLKVFGGADGNPMSDDPGTSVDPSSDDPSSDDPSSDDPSVNPSVDPGSLVTVSVDKEYLAANKSGELGNGAVMYSNDTNYANTVPTELRIYKGNNLTISSNYKIVEVKMVHTANNGQKWGNNSANEVSVDGGAGAYTMTADESSMESTISTPSGASYITLTATQAQIRITELTVTYIAQ